MKLHLSKSQYLIAVFCSIVFSSCYYDKAEVLYGTQNADCNTVSAKFSTDINPIIQSKCATAGCHNAASGAGGLVLISYSKVFQNLTKVNQRALIKKDMPVAGPLSPEEQNKLRCWINTGAPNN